MGEREKELEEEPAIALERLRRMWEAAWQRHGCEEWVAAEVDSWLDTEGMSVEGVALVGSALLKRVAPQAVLAVLEEEAPEWAAEIRELIGPFVEGGAAQEGSGRVEARQVWTVALQRMARVDKALALRVAIAASLRMDLAEAHLPGAAWLALAAA